LFDPVEAIRVELRLLAMWFGLLASGEHSDSGGIKDQMTAGDDGCFGWSSDDAVKTKMPTNVISHIYL
jgi:hypothetical protein